MEIEIGKARTAGGRTGSTRSRSCRRDGPATPTTSTSRGRSTRTRSALPMMAARWTPPSRPRTAVEIGRLGGLAVPEPRGPVDPVRGPRARSTRRSPRCPTRRPPGGCRSCTREPIKEELIGRRIREIKRGRGGRAARRSRRSGSSGTRQLVLEAGLDVLVIQGTVVSAEHVSTRTEPLNLKEFIAALRPPGDRRRVRVVLDGAPPDADRRRSACSSGVGPGNACTIAGRARHRGPAGDRDRRRGGRADASTCTRPAGTAT